MKRQRADGTWTWTTPEYDATWYWPVGTRVRLVNGEEAVVVKENAISVSVVESATGVLRTRVPFDGLRRVL